MNYELKNNVPVIRFPEFKEDWEVKIFDKFLIHTPRPKPKPKNNYLSIGLRSHFKGTFQKPNTDPNKNAMDTLYEVKENDFIVNITFAWEGALAIVTKEDDGGFVSHRFPTYNFEKGFDNLFFKYHFFKEKSKHQLGIVSPGGAGRNRVMNKKDFVKLKLPFPTLPEQQKIAHFFSTIDQKINQLQEKKNALEAYKKGMMQQIFSQKLRFKDDTSTSLSTGNAQSFPDWEVKKLGEVCEIVGGGTPDTTKQEYWGDTYNWFTPTEIKSDFVYASKRRITKLGLQKSSAKILPIGTILLTTRATIGEVAIAKEECTTNQGFQSLIVNKKNETMFIFNWIKMNKYELMKRANGSTFPEVSKKEILKIPIPSSCKAEQTKIANFLSKIDEKIENVNQQIAKTKEWKKGLLQKMFV